MQGGAVFRFDDFVLDERRRELLRNGERIAIRPTPLRLLTVLVRHAGEVIPRQQLFREVWPDTVVGDAALAGALRDLRRQLGDDGRHSSRIKTVRGRGLCFYSEVRVEGQDDRAVGDASSPRMRGHVAIPFVGRSGVMEELERSFLRAMEGQPTFLYLVGEPGIGKSRACTELAAIARRHDATVLSVRCSADVAAPSLWPVQQLLAQFENVNGRDGLLALMGDRLHDFAAVLPWLASRLGEPIPTTELPAEALLFRFFDATAEMLERATRDTPMLVVFDDLHNASDSLLRLLRFVARNLDWARLLILATGGEVGTDSDGLLHEMAAHGLMREVGLDPLELDAVAEFVEAFEGGPVNRRVAQRLARLSGGNPLFLEGLLHAGAVSEDPSRGEAPATQLRLAIERRLEIVSPECLELLTVASVLGDVFDLDIVREVAEAESSKNLAALDEAIEARLLWEIEPGRACFSHGLFRDVLYQALRPRARARLHARAARVLDDLQEAQWVELAHHYFNAGMEADPVRAYEACRRAAAEALRQLSFGEAAIQFRRALALLGPPSAETESSRSDLLLGLVTAFASLGRTDEAHEAARRAAELVTRERDPKRFAELALALVPGLRFESLDGVVRRLLEDALSRVPEEDAALRGRLMAALPASRQSFDSGVDGEPGAEDPRVLAELLTSWHWAEWDPTLIERRSNVAAEIVELGRRTESPETVLDGLFFQANDALECGAVDLFRESVEEHTRLAGVVADPSHVRRSHQLRAMQLGVEGDFAGAERTATEALELGEVPSLHALESVIAQMSHRMERLVQEERFDEMERELMPLPDAGPNRTTVVASWADFYRFVGQLEDARRVFGTLAARDFEEVPQKAEDLHMLADVCVALNDRRAATILSERLRPWRERMLIAPSCSICFGAGDRFLGNLAIARGAFGEAADHFERALWLCKRLEASPFIIDIQIDHGRLRRLRGAQGDASVARRLLMEALDSAEHRGFKQRANAAREQIAAL